LRSLKTNKIHYKEKLKKQKIKERKRREREEGK